MVDYTPPGPGAFDLTSPPGIGNGATDQPTTGTITFNWTTSSGSTAYDLCLSSTENQPTTVYASNVTQNTPVTLNPALSPNTLYRWRIKARDCGGNSTYSTSTWTFTTAAVPVAPFNLAPTGTNRNVTGNITWSWVQSSGGPATKFEVWYGDAYENKLGEVTGEPYGIPYNFPPGQTINYKVVVIGPGGTSEATESFTTATPPDAPILADPADKAENQSYNRLPALAQGKWSHQL